VKCSGGALGGGLQTASHHLNGPISWMWRRQAYQLLRSLGCEFCVPSFAIGVFPRPACCVARGAPIWRWPNCNHHSVCASKEEQGSAASEMASLACLAKGIILFSISAFYLRPSIR
jgi:hypothetical protein